MAVDFKQYDRDPDDKYDESWRRYGNKGAELDADSGLRNITLSTNKDGVNTLTVTGDASKKSDGYVAKNIAALLGEAGITATQDSTGSTVKFTVNGASDDSIIRAAAALSRPEKNDVHPVIDERVAAEIITSEKKLLRDSVIKGATGKAPASAGRTD